MSDFEIEYLDEDADLVQLCVNGAIPSTTGSEPSSLLIEIDKSVRPKRKPRRDYEDDEDYHPSKDKEVFRKKRKPTPTPKVEKASKTKSTTPVVQKKKAHKIQTITKQRERIQLPDYLDGLCLPQKPINTSDNLKRVKEWNKICVDAHNKCDRPLQPDRKRETDITVSKRVTVFRKVKNKVTGKIEPTVWSKTQVENKEGKMNSIVNQGVLPSFSVDGKFTFKMFESNKRTGYKTQTSVVLSNEGTFKDPILQVYQPDKKTCTIFKTVEKVKYVNEKKKSFRYLEEQSSDLVCASCYQYSWNDSTTKNKVLVPCEICGEKFPSTYSMLIHLKIHDDQPMRKLRNTIISKSLSKLVNQKNLCRVCQMPFSHARDLKKHVLEHQGKLLFKCSLGNHVTR